MQYNLSMYLNPDMPLNVNFYALKCTNICLLCNIIIKLIMINTKLNQILTNTKSPIFIQKNMLMI
jgi:hypothetical protein